MIIYLGSPFFAAKSYEQAAQMTQQLPDLATAAKYYDRAGQLYAEGGINSVWWKLENK
jgi:hypothetical protein